MLFLRPHFSCSFSTAAGASSPPLILGCGSNVIDAFFNVRKLPLPGEKAYFSDERFCTATLVGGVTLNHLTWARALGAPTGLLALQGADENGEQIRACMRDHGVATEHIRVSPSHTTSVSHVLVEGGGERTIIMAKASTSQITGERVLREWGALIGSSSSRSPGGGMLTTEISQVPLSGVEALLDTARSSGLHTLLDVDVTPTIAAGAAGLGLLGGCHHNRQPLQLGGVHRHTLR